MKYKEVLKKLVEYEKNLSGPTFGLQVLALSILIAFLTNHEIEKHNNAISKESMAYLIENYKEDETLIIPSYDKELDDGLIATGDVLVTYLEEYNISVAIVGNKIITEDGNNNLEEFEIEEEYLSEIKKILSYEEVAKRYNLESSNNYWFNSNKDNKIVLELKK